jgi:nucleoside-diphosphate-sugar epimerase
MDIPELIESEDQLDDVMSMPSSGLIDMMKSLEGDIMILGIGGKMGISLGIEAVRACKAAGVEKNIIGVSRFSDSAVSDKLTAAGLQCISCDLLDRFSVDRLPQVPNIVYMAGRKFGTDGGEAMTWASNTVIPANVVHHFSDSRIVVFSTGNIYPLVAVTSEGALETTSPAPIGEYAQSCLGRERVFMWGSLENETPMLLFRLNYAVDLRYGVLFDIGTKVFNDQGVELDTGYFNCIWQGDANTQALLSLAHCASPPTILNVTGPETVSVRLVAEAFSGIFGKPADLAGTENPTAFLSNSKVATDLFGYPTVSLQRLIEWTAHWIEIGGASLGKPTHFEVRNGNY